MSHAKPYYYWSEARFVTTSNSQWVLGGPTLVAVPALRENDDTYVRSVWSARLTYYSPGTGTTYGWWGAADVRLVISSDPQALETPSDIGDNDQLTLGYTPMYPTWTAGYQGTNTYMVDWTTSRKPLELSTRRDFVDAGHRPQVLASIFAFDQNGFFALLESGGKIVRAQIQGRVLWESSNSGL